jgi:hypothetical protein
MRHRNALVLAACWLLSFGCGGGDAGPTAVVKNTDAGKPDGGSTPPDAGQPVVKDAGKPAADSGKPITKDAGVDSGPTLPIDAGPGDVGVDAGPAPSTWKCAAALWADGYCDCGCGVADFDCTGQSCSELGCIAPSCDACYTTELAWKPCTAAPDPSAWTCSMAEQLDEACDCGCGIPDARCGGSGCSEPGCYRPKCNVRHGAQGAVLTDMFPPFNGWKCPAAAWGGGDGCDCGCGATDPDCKSAQSCTAPLCNAAECKVCHDSSGRTVPCTNALHEWTCDPQRFGSADGCDCGCGAPDPDCADKGCSGYGCRDAACARCTDSSYASDKLVGCGAADTWKCDLSHYGTGDGCDCGCGVRDPDCAASDGCTDPGCQSDKCEYCHRGDSADPRADDDYQICDPPGDAKGWTCGSATDPAWANAECDCGCGRPDPYCRLKQQKSCVASGCETATCEYCNKEGSERARCDGARWLSSGLCTASNYGLDGQCDCGCGAVDPDCGADMGCAAPQCAAKGCEVCHNGSNLLGTCYTWTCPTAAYGDGKVCDCGCGAPDPDCSGLGCIEPGCRDSMCSPDGCHDPFGRSVRCP